MVKHGNNPSGKSDRHQQHNLKYAASHAPAALERWYKKITTPKPVKVKVSRKVSVCNRTVDLDRAAEIKHCTMLYERQLKKDEKTRLWIEKTKEYYRLNPHKWEQKQMALNDK
jgi:hypothetical protein